MLSASLLPSETDFNCQSHLLCRRRMKKILRRQGIVYHATVSVDHIDQRRSGIRK